MKSIVVCGSKRFRHEIAVYCDQLEDGGAVVFRPNIDSPIYEHEQFPSPDITRIVFKGLTLEHFDMIRKSDVCFIYNRGSYIGPSVTLEMGFANALGKPIYALEPTTGDPCSDSLIDDVASCPKSLLAKLQ